MSSFSPANVMRWRQRTNFTHVAPGRCMCLSTPSDLNHKWLRVSKGLGFNYLLGCFGNAPMFVDLSGWFALQEWHSCFMFGSQASNGKGEKKERGEGEKERERERERESRNFCSCSSLPSSITHTMPVYVLIVVKTEDLNFSNWRYEHFSHAFLHGTHHFLSFKCTLLLVSKCISELTFTAKVDATQDSPFYE